MTTIRLAAAALAFTLGLVALPGIAAAAPYQCKHTADQYAQAIRHFETEAAKARALAARDPLYESDVAYYKSVLDDARTCVRRMGPIATASR
jgi:hypothetical protein